MIRKQLRYLTILEHCRALSVEFRTALYRFCIVAARGISRIEPLTSGDGWKSAEHDGRVQRDRVDGTQFTVLPERRGAS